MLYRRTRSHFFVYLRGPQVPLDQSTSQAAHLGETRLGLSVLDGIVASSLIVVSQNPPRRCTSQANAVSCPSAGSLP